MLKSKYFKIHKCEIIRRINFKFYFKVCGNFYVTNNLKIVGGIVANVGSWPSIAYMNWNYKGTYLLPTGVRVSVNVPTIACAGTLISKRHILTAGKIIQIYKTHYLLNFLIL